jgi:pimeloyl-ACP methyl ester carboxylesterase
LSRRWDERFEEPLPASIGKSAESVRLKTRDGEELGAWYLPPSRADAPSVAVFHGWLADRTSRVGAAKVFAGEGCGVLLVTHRCHGDSTGELEDFGWSAQLDVVAAVDWLEQRRPGVKIAVCGSSLGAAAATFAARELGPRVAGYVLECPYSSIDDATWNRARIFLFPPLDWIAYAGARLGATCFDEHWDETCPRDAAAAFPREASVLVFAGERDTRATPAEVESIAARVPGPHEFVVVPGAAHDRLLAAPNAAYATAVRAWLARLAKS